MADFRIKEGDTRPTFRITVYDEDGNVVDVTGATVEFRLLYDDGDRFTSAATIVNATGGVIEYQFAASETQNKAGTHQGEFGVTLSGGDTLSVPSDRYYSVEVLPKL